MQAVQYLKSVPRYLATRYGGRAWGGLYTSSWGCIELVDLAPLPLPGPNWVRVRPILSGICGSDLATITAKGSTYFAPLTSCPFVLGHEVVGEVQETAPGVDSLTAGDRVVLQPPLHCAVRGIEELCDRCSAGRLSQCRNVMRGVLAAGIQTGFCRDTGGGWSEGFVAHTKQLHRVPDDLTNELAVLVEPFSCSLHAVTTAPLAGDKTVVVLGGGTIGILTIAALRALGHRCRILAVAKHTHQKELAKTFGADVVIGTRDFDREMPALLGAEAHKPEIGRPVVLGGADFVFDCVGSDRSIDNALRFTRSGGFVMLVGMPGIPKKVDWTSIWYKELTVKGVYTSDAEIFRRAIEIITERREKFALVPTAEFPLARYKEAVQHALHTGRTGISKTLLRP